MNIQYLKSLAMGALLVAQGYGLDLDSIKSGIGERKLQLHLEKSHTCKSKSEVSKSQLVTLDLSDPGNNQLDLPFQIKVSYEVFGNVVSLHIPAFNFDLPVDGFVFTIDGFLPREIWPNDPLYQSFFIGNDNVGDNFQVHVSNAGSLIFLATEGLYFTPGAHQVQATTVTYFLNGSLLDHKPPKNVQVSSGPSNVVGTDNDTLLPFDFLEFHQIDILTVGNKTRFAIWWPDNAEDLSPKGRNHLSLVVRTGYIKTDPCGKQEICFNGPPVRAIKAPEGVFIVEGGITINPKNPNNLFVASVVIDYRNDNLLKAANGDPAGQDNLFQLWTAYSFDGGKTWTSQRVDKTPGFTLYPLDGLTPVFDRFGNLWVASAGGTNGDVLTSFITGQGVVGAPLTFGISTDGGQTFSNVGTAPLPVPPDVNTQFFNAQDYPKATFGGDGQGGFAFYVNTTYVLFNNNFTGQISKYLTYVPVQGFNQFGSIVNVQIPETLVTENNPLDINLEASEIVVSDQGKIMLFGFAANFCCLSPEGVNQCVVDTTGIVNFDLGNGTTGTAFSGPFAVAKTNVNTFSFIPFQPSRGLNAQGYGLSYDPDKDRFYACMTDEQPLGSGNMVLYLVFSDNNGQSWSRPVLVANSVTSARGSISMKRDPVSGSIIFAWQDARNQENQQEVNTFLAIFTKEELDKLQK